MPGYVAGASLVFVKVFDDVASPLLLNVKEMLAPQAYLRITSIGIDDPMGYVISVVLIAIAVVTMWGSAPGAEGQGLRHRAARRRRAGAAAPDARPVGAGLRAWCCWCWPSSWRRTSACCCCPSPRCGHSAPCPTALPWPTTPASWATARTYIKNTLLYSGLAAAIDVAIGGAIAYLVLRTRLPGRQMLDWLAGAALAVPGVVLGIGYLRAFYGVHAAGRRAAGDACGS